MSEAIDAAVATLRSRDPSAYQKARTEYHAAGTRQDAESRKIAEAGRKSYATLMAALRRKLAPHDIEWNNSCPPTWGCADVNHDAWTTGVHLSGVIWARSPGKYVLQMRMRLDFSFSPRTGAEFLAAAAALKATADAMAAGLYGDE